MDLLGGVVNMNAQSESRTRTLQIRSGVLEQFCGLLHRHCRGPVGRNQIHTSIQAQDLHRMWMIKEKREKGGKWMIKRFLFLCGCIWMCEFYTTPVNSPMFLRMLAKEWVGLMIIGFSDLSCTPRTRSCLPCLFYTHDTVCRSRLGYAQSGDRLVVGIHLSSVFGDDFVGGQ